MTCLSERIVGVIVCLASGYAFADGFTVDSPEVMTVANIAPLPVELVPPIPQPQRYLYRYVMESQPNQGNPFHAQIEDFYSAPVTHDFRFGAGKATLTPEQMPHQASNSLNPGASSAPQLSIVQLQNTTLTTAAQPERRLSLTVNNWVYSATARVAVLHSHNTGATLSVRHRF